MLRVAVDEERVVQAADFAAAARDDLVESLERVLGDQALLAAEELAPTSNATTRVGFVAGSLKSETLFECHGTRVRPTV